jgi:hypothetical protein
MRNLGFLLMALCTGCAQIVSPTGGPKDELPPEVVSMDPPTLSTRFAADRFSITFNEFVQLQGATEQVMVSPPLGVPPDVRLDRRTITVHLPDSLRPNTTYTVNFGEAVRDLNEGNIIQNLTYVFSTGEAVDSMQISGRLVKAEDGAAVDGAWAMLYGGTHDSLPRTALPDYFAKTGKDGRFTITNIPDRPFRLFALKDENANYRFDAVNELIGFPDSLISPIYIAPPAPADTAAVSDTLGTETSALPDTTATAAKGKGMKGGATDDRAAGTVVRMFAEPDTNQYLRKAWCEHFGKVVLAYNLPVGRARVGVEAITFKKEWKILEYSPRRDTLTVWTTDLPDDSVSIIIDRGDGMTDTAQVEMKPRSEKVDVAGVGGGKGVRGRTQKDFRLEGYIPAQMLPRPGQPLVVKFNHPVRDLSLKGAVLMRDSLPVSFDIELTDTALRTWNVLHDWQLGSAYSIWFPPGAFKDLYGLTSDTLKAAFTLPRVDELGRITFNIKGPESRPLVAEVRDKGGNTVGRLAFTAQAMLDMPMLPVGTYTLRAIDDTNGNGRWDTGSYREGRQPERIVLYDKGIDVRANWDQELDWDIGPELAK